MSDKMWKTATGYATPDEANAAFLNQAMQIKALADALAAILQHKGTKAALESLSPEAYEDAFALRADARAALRLVGRLP